MKSMKLKVWLPVSILLLLAAGLAWNSAWRKPAAAAREARESSKVAARSRSADRPEPDAERERRRQESISLAAQRWYEELLEKYPRMKQPSREVPDEQNGYLQMLLIAESPSMIDQESLSEDLLAMLQGDSEWDVQKFDAFLAANHEFFEKILHIAEFPDQSAIGVELYGRTFEAIPKSNFLAMFLRSAARNAFESGDQETALRYTKATNSLASQLVQIETPSLIGGMIAGVIRKQTQDSFRENILPSLVNDPEALRAWRAAVFTDEPPSEEYSRVVIGEWNTTMRNVILPALLGKQASHVNHPGEFLDLYTALTLKSVDGVAGLGQNRFDAANAGITLPDSGLDATSNELLASMVTQYQRINQSMGAQITTAAMNSAAISILLGEAPPVDPVSGKPFSWDPKTRLLTAPEGVSKTEPIKVP